MNKEKVKEIMTTMGNTQFGAALNLWLDDEEDDLRMIEECKTLEELEGRKFALKIISNLRKAVSSTSVAPKSKTSYT